MSTIQIHTEAGVARLTLNRPDKRNAINDEMRSELVTAFAAFDADPAVRAVILTGAGRHSVPAAISTATMIPPDFSRSRIVEPLDQFSKPIIAAINGLAYGGGLEIAARLRHPDCIDRGALRVAGGAHRQHARERRHATNLAAWSGRHLPRVCC